MFTTRLQKPINTYLLYYYYYYYSNNLLALPLDTFTSHRAHPSLADPLPHDSGF